MTQITEELKSSFEERFKCIDRNCDGAGNIPHQIAEGEWEAQQCQFCFEHRFPLLSFIADREALAERRGEQSERQFILNVLDGIDIADRNSGDIVGGTKAIRFALQSRILPDLPTSEKGQ